MANVTAIEREVDEAVKPFITHSLLGMGTFGPVRDQKNCSCCWILSSEDCASGTTTCQYGGQFIQLSLQEVIDCYKDRYSTLTTTSNNEPNSISCFPGKPGQAMQYMKHHGVFEEEHGDKYYIYHWEDCADYNKDAINELLDGGNVVVGKFVFPDSEVPKLRAHKRPGVLTIRYPETYTDKDVEDWPRHAFVIVGYGDEHYLIKNSWSRSWGIHGYGVIPRSQVTPQCYCSFLTTDNPHA